MEASYTDGEGQSVDIRFQHLSKLLQDVCVLEKEAAAVSMVRVRNMAGVSHLLWGGCMGKAEENILQLLGLFLDEVICLLSLLLLFQGNFPGKKEPDKEEERQRREMEEEE